MPHWNYRVVRSADGEYGIHECYYDPLGWTAEPVAVTADSVEGLRDELNHMLLALDAEVLEP